MNVIIQWPTASGVLLKLVINAETHFAFVRHFTNIYYNFRIRTITFTFTINVFCCGLSADFLNRKLRFLGHQISWVSDWLSMRFFSLGCTCRPLVKHPAKDTNLKSADNGGPPSIKKQASLYVFLTLSLQLAISSGKGFLDTAHETLAAGIVNVNKYVHSNLVRGPRRGAVAHIRRKVPIGYNGALQIRLQKYPFPWTDPKPHYLPHRWTHPTYDAKRHRDPSAVFPQCTGQTDARTYARTDRQIVLHRKVQRL